MISIILHRDPANLSENVLSYYKERVAKNQLHEGFFYMHTHNYIHMQISIANAHDTVIIICACMHIGTAIHVYVAILGVR